MIQLTDQIVHALPPYSGCGRRRGAVAVRVDVKCQACDISGVHSGCAATSQMLSTYELGLCRMTMDHGNRIVEEFHLRYDAAFFKLFMIEGLYGAADRCLPGFGGCAHSGNLDQCRG